MRFTSWLYCMLLSLYTFTVMELKLLQHVEGEQHPSPPLGAHGGSGSSLAEPGTGCQPSKCCS